MKKNIISLVLCTALLFSSVGITSAHVVVKPNSVGVGTFQVFTIGVPVEKDVPTTGMRIVIPEGLEYVSPNVKPGWTIDIKKIGTGDDAKVTEIEWKGGSIPSGQRDDFFFSGKVPSKATELNWKAYQTYKDGSVVSWDVDPKMEMDHDTEDSKSGPYSVTKVIDDLSAVPVTQTIITQTSPKVKALTIISFGLSVAALAVALKRKSV